MNWSDFRKMCHESDRYLQTSVKGPVVVYVNSIKDEPIDDEEDAVEKLENRNLDNIDSDQELYSNELPDTIKSECIYEEELPDANEGDMDMTSSIISEEDPLTPNNSSVPNSAPAEDPEHPYKCIDCGRGFKRKAALTYHKRKLYDCLKDQSTGSWEKQTSGPAQCPICNTGKMDIAYLRKHFAKHTKERPFECPCCYFRYGTKHSVKIHLKKHHPLTKLENLIIKKKVKSDNPYPWENMGYEIMVNPSGLSKIVRKSATVDCTPIEPGNIVPGEDDKVVYCPYCNNRFHNEGILNIHMDQHINGWTVDPAEWRRKYAASK